MPDDHGHLPGDRDDARADRLAAAAAELYGAAPEAFTERRAELAAQARGAGDRAAAKAIGALRKPTRAAWVVNRLARTDPSAPGKLAELAGALRAAQQAGHGPRLRELSAGRGALIDALTDQALAVADVPDPPPSLRLEVSETLAAALADPEVAAAFAAGTLTRAAQWSGFGMPPAENVDRLARESGERAARRREQYAEAERVATAASQTASEASSAEHRLEAEVRELEQRLTQARAELAGARMRARQAEAAERRARQVLDRLPPP